MAIKQDINCHKCFTNKVNTILVLCKHKILCYECVSKNKKCLLCNSNYSNFFNI